MKRPAPEQEKSSSKKKSKKEEVVLLKVTKTNEEYGSTAGARMVADGKKAPRTPPKSKSAKKGGDVKLTKVKPLNTGYEERDPVVSFKEGKSKAVGFSPPDPRTSLASAQKKRALDNSPPKVIEQNGKPKPVKNIYTGFESSKVVKMEQTSQLR